MVVALDRICSDGCRHDTCMRFMAEDMMLVCGGILYLAYAPCFFIKIIKLGKSTVNESIMDLLSCHYPVCIFLICDCVLSLFDSKWVHFDSFIILLYY